MPVIATARVEARVAYWGVGARLDTLALMLPLCTTPATESAEAEKPVCGQFKERPAAQREDTAQMDEPFYTFIKPGVIQAVRIKVLAIAGCLLAPMAGLFDSMRFSLSRMSCEQDQYV